jgi:hypothetical protein
MRSRAFQTNGKESSLRKDEFQSVEMVFEAVGFSLGVAESQIAIARDQQLVKPPSHFVKRFSNA